MDRLLTACTAGLALLVIPAVSEGGGPMSSTPRSAPALQVFRQIDLTGTLADIDVELNPARYWSEVSGRPRLAEEELEREGEEDGSKACPAPAGEGDADAPLPTVFEDDFEQGVDRWEPLGEKNECWRVEETDRGKSYHQFRNFGKPLGKHRSPFNIALVRDLVLEDFVFEADVKSTKKNYAHRDVCFFFGFRDPDHFQYVHFGLKTDAVSNRIMVVDGAPRKNTDEAATRGTPWTDGWHRLKVVFDAAKATVTVYFDDMTKPHMKTENVKFTSGRIGVGSFDDTGMWDNVRIRGKVRPGDDEAAPQAPQVTRDVAGEAQKGRR